MVKRFLTALTFISILSVSPAMSQLRGISYAEASAANSGTITYTYVTSPGFSELNANNELEGICVGIMDSFVEWVRTTKGIGLNTRVQAASTDPSSFQDFMAGVKSAQGGVFGLGNITITQARQREYNFSPAIIPNVSIMVTHNSVPTLNSLEALPATFNGFTCYVVRGTTNARRMRELAAKYYPELNIVEVATSEETLQRVIQNKKSFTNLDFTYYLAIFKRNMPLKRHPVGDDATEQMGIIMPQNNDWAPLLTEFLDSGFLESAEYKTILAKYLRRDVLELLKVM